MTEPDVAITDYLLTIQSTAFAVINWRHSPRTDRLRIWFTLFFIGIAGATLCGGTVHGFFQSEFTTGYAILWPMTMAFVGVSTLATWMLGATLALSPETTRRVLLAANVLLAVYLLIVLFITSKFLVAVVANGAAVVFLLLCALLEYHRHRRPGLMPLAGGATLIILGGVLQQLHVAIHPVYFNHNALYHAIQAVTLVLFVIGAKNSRPPTDRLTGATDVHTP